MTLAYDIAGSGPAVVLLHSTVCDRRMWDPQWPALIEAGNTAIRCDFRGFGETPTADAAHNDADDVLDLLGALGLGAATLVASSYGGRVALEVAARRPQRVSALALLCAGAPSHEPTDALTGFWEREESLLDAGDIAAAVELNLQTWLGPQADAAARAHVRMMQRHAFEVQLADARKFEAVEYEFDLASIGVPALVVSGAHDLPDFGLIAARLADLLPGARAVELDWAGHLPNLERPAELTAVLLDFLEEPRTIG
jgi:pimeloyl-ACP methyl ester carboxylesterase